MKYYFILLFAFCLLQLKGQDSQEVTALYRNAMTLYEKKDTFGAIADFEKIIKLNPNHRNSLYNLAILNYQLGDNATAIRLLRRCLKLNDKEAAKLLTKQFHQTLTYADTMQNIDPSTSKKFEKIKTTKIQTLNELAQSIVSSSPSKKEQLQLLLLWSHENFKADSNRFFNGGTPLSLEESFARREGLCEEYSNIFEEFCRLANIENFKIAGYVKYPNFKPADTFDQSNHAWNAVNLDNTWLVCDLFWSTTALDIASSSQPRFIRRLDTDYFLGQPSAFNSDHLPCDPIFQFSENPISIKAFTNKVFGIDSTISKMPYLNFTDSIRVFSKINSNERSMRSALNSYRFNKDNPNSLITESYNYAVDILNNRTATKYELMSAKSSLTLALSIIDQSKDEQIKGLQSECERGLQWITKRIANSL